MIMNPNKLLNHTCMWPLRHPGGQRELRKRVLRGMCLTTVIMLFACAHYPVNSRLENPEMVTDTQKVIRKSMKQSDDLLLLLAFSGGGTRAAALSYGILEALAAVEIPGSVPTSSPAETHSLLKEVDIITGVSGGSFTAAYYGLHGERIFEDYRKRFLTRKVRNDLLYRILFNPVNWFKMWGGKYGKSDLAADYYDQILFEGATLGDIFNRGGPFIHIQATDMVDGLYFGFTPKQFQLICSDMNSVPVARAVAASAAFPGPFGPIVLHNYAGSCGGKIPAWVEQAIEERDTSSRRFQTAMHLKTFTDSEKKPYIYLLDGGISDNLGIRGPTELIAARGGPLGFIEEVGFQKPKRIAIIIVNAATRVKYEWSQLGVLPGLGDIIGATSSTMVDSYNYETLWLLRHFADEWMRESIAEGESPPEVYIMVVGFNLLSNAEERKSFNEISTDLQLPEKDVDRLREVAVRLLYASKDFQILVKKLGGSIPKNQ